MALELNEEQKKELAEMVDAKAQERLKELGYDDHAKKVIERANAEAKAHREAKEKTDLELKQYRDADAKRKTEEEARKAEEDAARKKSEDEKKTVEQRIVALEETFKRELTKREEAMLKKQQEYLDDLKARDAQVLMMAVKTEASKRGIIDDDLVSLLDVSKVPIEKGIPDHSKITELIEEHAKTKPHLYRENKGEGSRDERGRFATQNARPEANSRPSSSVDAAKLNDADFEAMTARLRAGRA